MISMQLIHGTAVQLGVKTKTGEDGFGAPIYETEFVTVENVLVGQPTADEVTSELALSGKTTEFMLGIPKGDTHEWEDIEVIIFGKKYRTAGGVIQGIEENVPGPWHKKVRVVRYEQGNIQT